MAHQTESRTGGSGGFATAAVAILATAPRPGLALPGTCPPLRPAEAAGLQTAWLKHVATELPGVAVHLCGRPADAMPMLRYFAGPGVELRAWANVHAGPLRREDLAQVADELFAAGHAPVLVRTADVPDVAPDLLQLCLDAARDPDAGPVLGRDQRGAPWLLAAADAVTLRRDATRRGPWARRVEDATDLWLLWHERAGADAHEPPLLPVRDLQAALRWHEVVLDAELAARDDDAATVLGPYGRLRLVAHGPQLRPNGLSVRCADAAAIAAALAPHRVIARGDELAERIGGGTAVTATDDSGNRLTFVDGGFAR